MSEEAREKDQGRVVNPGETQPMNQDQAQDGARANELGPFDPAEAEGGEEPQAMPPAWEDFGSASEGGEVAAETEEPVVRPVRFGPVANAPAAGDRANIELLLDVKLPVTVELGRTEVLVKEILDYGPGSVIELAKQANEPVDLYVNGVLVARGEVVVIEDRFGVRLTSLISPEERILSLGGAA
ncbi:MAG: flagellar motor switch protein FliN [Candidatus Eisenbacteria bacterium]